MQKLVLVVGKDHLQFNSQFTHRLACVTCIETCRLPIRIFTTFNMHFTHGLIMTKLNPT